LSISDNARLSVLLELLLLLYSHNLPASKRSSKDMEMSKMEQNSGESRSGEAMNIFGQSIIDVRRTGRSRRRATQTVPVPSES
jgi:hypothetical protein